MQTIAGGGGLKKMVTENLGEIDARGINSIPLFRDDAGRDVVVRVGRYGPYLQRTMPGRRGRAAPVGRGGRPTATRRPGLAARRHRARTS